MDEGAVADATSGALNPIGTLGITPPPPPPGSTTGPTTPPAPPVPKLPPLVIPPAVKKPTPTGCVTHKVITLHLLKSVSARLKSATATLNGKAYPVSKGLVITISLSKYTKLKTLTLKIKGKPKTGARRSTRRGSTIRVGPRRRPRQRRSLRRRRAGRSRPDGLLQPKRTLPFDRARA